MRRCLRLSGVFIVNFEHILHIFLLFILLTLNKQMLAGKSEAKENSYFSLEKGKVGNEKNNLARTKFI